MKEGWYLKMFDDDDEFLDYNFSFLERSVSNEIPNVSVGNVVESPSRPIAEEQANWF